MALERERVVFDFPQSAKCGCMTFIGISSLINVLRLVEDDTAALPLLGAAAHRGAVR